MGTAIAIGIIQGIAEWLPISSEGLVSVVYEVSYDLPLQEAIYFSLWLHMGTVPCVLIMFHREIKGMLADFSDLRTKPSPLLYFLTISTLISIPIGLCFLLFIQELSSLIKLGAITLIGSLTILNGVMRFRKNGNNARSRRNLSAIDAVWAGVAQGVSVLPGLSRSGTTIAVLLSRRINHKEALIISYLMSVPSSLAVSFFVTVNYGVSFSHEVMASLAFAFIVGTLTIKVMLSFSERVNFSWFSIALGIAMVIGVWSNPIHNLL